jgi:phospholipid N-methyltransferase
MTMALLDLMVKGEAVIRMEAERSLVRKFRSEYQRLAATAGHQEAIRTLVAKRKREYDAIVREARERVRARHTPAPDRAA